MRTDQPVSAIEYELRDDQSMISRTGVNGNELTRSVGAFMLK